MPRWVYPQAIIDKIDEMANKKKEKAFLHDGRLHFFSGPNEPVWDLISGEKERNFPRAVRWAKSHDATLLGNTEIGMYLSNYKGMGTADYFRINPLINDPEEKRRAGLRPWVYASHLFALSAYGHVTTTVCGADREGVYYATELPNLVAPNYSGLSAATFLASLATPRNKEVVAINLIPFAQILEARDANGIEAAHTKICLGEQRMALHEALDSSSPKAIREALKHAKREVLSKPSDAYKYYLECQEQFLVDRALYMKGTKFSEDFLKNKTPVVRQQQREERLNHFTSKVLLLIETEIALLPPASRPDFIVPSYLRRVAPR